LGLISAFRIRGLREEIEVYVRDGQLLTDHRFYFLGCNFLTLLYVLDRKPRLADEAPKDMVHLLQKAPSVRASSALPLTQAP